MGTGSNGNSDCLTPRPSTALYKGHKRAMSHQYGNNNSSVVSKTNSDYESLTAGNLGIDFPSNFYSTHASNYSSSSTNLKSSAGGGACIIGFGGALGSSEGTQLTSRVNCSSSSSALIDCGGDVVIGSNNLGGDGGLLSSGNNNININLTSSLTKCCNDSSTKSLEQLSEHNFNEAPSHHHHHHLHERHGSKDGSGGDHDAAGHHDSLSLCSLPPYSDIKDLLHDSIDSSSNATLNISADQKTKQLSSKAIRNELKKTFIAFIFQQVTQLIMIWTVVKSNDRMDLESPVLPDIVLSEIPVVKRAGQISEILLFTLFVVFTFVILFHKHRFLVLRRVLAVTGICLIIRSFCVWATVLPRSLSSMECAPKSRNSGEVLHRVFILYITSGLSIFGGHMCGNYFFSGHTCLMTIVHAAFYQYTPDVLSPMKKITTLLCITIAVLILLAHNHYTLDIIGAYYVSSRVWMFYHFLAHNPQYRISSQLSFFWSWLVNIFEDGSECHVKNEFQSLREIYQMLCQQTEAHLTGTHTRNKSRNSQKLQTV